MVLAAFTSIGEAEAARSALAAAAIDATIADENIVAMNWLYSNAIGGVKVLVPEEDLEQAERILAGPADEEFAEDEAIGEEPEAETPRPFVCSACGSADVARLPKRMLFAALSIVVIGAGVAVRQTELAFAGVAAVALILLLVESHHCRNCGERWSPEAPVEDTIVAPPPEPSDRLGMICPRCGRPEIHPIRYRRLKAVPLGATLLIFLILPLWVFLPKKKCDHCGLRLWL